MKNTEYVAVHVITESSDHYNMLLSVVDIDDLVEQIKTNMYGDHQSISDLHLSGENGNLSIIKGDVFERLLGDEDED